MRTYAIAGPRPALTLHQPFSKEPSMRAIIIGAGIAGLAAALRLSQIGWDILIIERVPTRRSGGYAVTFDSSSCSSSSVKDFPTSSTTRS
ncbi:FAD-dependent oxidoreductase [Nonomuraea sp. NPDC050643]|uniref:FAD-dependent oxidoreductase n=1 Tax=Nonomuraea sp. NPDC050643 TaxID=3155660 RepID=UPI003410B91F